MKITEVRITFITDEGPVRTGFILPPSAVKRMNRDRTSLCNYLSEELRVIVFSMLHSGGNIDG
jgi:hypothetical protein